MSQLILPGMVDAHVHLREPGATHKEDALTGTRAALAGGVVGVLDMPNNRPAIVDRATLADKMRLFSEKAVTDYGLLLGYEGGDVSPLVELAGQVVGLKLYLDETFGDLTLDHRALAAVFEAWPGPGPIAVHAESPSIRVALGMARRYGQRLHVCHVPHPDDLLAVDAARQQGAEVTCEVTPHHLFLSTDDLPALGAYGRMKPPLISAQAVAQFWARLHLVDIVASDHAPHTRAEKDGANPPPGVPGLETTMPLLLRAVDEGRLTMERLAELVTGNPCRIYGLSLAADTRVEWEIGEPYALPAAGYHTRCGWSPFRGQTALGRVARVWLRGRMAYEDGQVRVEPGYGRPLVPPRGADA